MKRKEKPPRPIIRTVMTSPAFAVPSVPLYPEYKILAPDDTLSFSIEFNVIPKDVKTFDFIMKPGTGIFGITTEKDSNE